jgi:transglutaminase-like putative cysteine protease
MAITAVYEPQRTGSAEKFFQASLYLLLVTGFTALTSTGKLDLPSLAIVAPALLVRGLHLVRGKTVMISERWTTYLTLFYFAFYAADYFLISQSFINATVHLVLFSMVVKIFSVQRDRDLIYLAVLSFLMVLAAAVLTVDTVFLLTFALFLMLAMATFVSMEMRRSERAAMAIGVPPKQDRKFQRMLSGTAVLLGVSTFVGAALIFFVLPRGNSGGYLRSLGAQGEFVSGFSQDVTLGGIGQIQQSRAVVMHVQVLNGKLPADIKWRGIALTNFDGKRWWNNPGDAPVKQPLSNAGLDLGQFRVRNSLLYASSPSVRHWPTLSYKIVMEPVGIDVFFLAPVPLKINGGYSSVAITPDGSVLNSRSGIVSSKGEIETPQAIGIYLAESDTRDPEPLVRDSNSQDYPPRLALLYRQLPNLDPRIPRLAKQITAGSASNYLRAKAIENYLQTELGYTLQLPGRAETDPLAAFLFVRKKGHCEYFATSMAVMLRTLEIPARVVNGFRGGQYNDVTSSYIVRGKDAHSWVEAYFPEYGWVTFDPTPAGGLDAPATGWSRAALYMDAMRELWREWIINYDFTHQMRLSAALASETGKAQFGVRWWLRKKYRGLLITALNWQRRAQHLPARDVVLYCVLLLLLLLLPFVPRGWRALQRGRLLRNPQLAPRSAASFWYLRMLKAVERRGFRKSVTQTPAEFADSIDDLSVRRNVAAFTDHYQRARFAESVEDARRLPDLYAELTAAK